MVYRRRKPLYKKKQAIRRRRGMKRRGGFRSKYHGMKFFKETAKGVDVAMPGGGNNLRLKLTASIEDISSLAAYGAVDTKSAFKTLFGRYCITGVKWTFIPRYVSTDSTGRAADRVVYAINRDPNDPVGNELGVLRQDDAKFTNTSRKFVIYCKHPKPVLYATAGDANRTANQMPEPAGGSNITVPQTNQVSATLGNNKWIWLPTRIIPNPETGETLQAPDHVGADVHITSCNPAVAEPYVVYTMFKTVYYAFKEQD